MAYRLLKLQERIPLVKGFKVINQQWDAAVFLIPVPPAGVWMAAQLQMKILMLETEQGSECHLLRRLIMVREPATSQGEGLLSLLRHLLLQMALSSVSA
jgi:hypothetical protein